MTSKAHPPTFRNLVDFTNPKEVARLLNDLDKDNLTNEELKSLAKNLVIRVSFYLKNRFATDRY